MRLHVLPHLFVVPLVLAPLAFAACGGSSGSEFDDGSNGLGASGGTSSSGSLGSSGASGGTSGGASGGPVCAAKTSNADRKAANLFFVFDQSKSMAYPPPYNDVPASEKAKRWTPAVTALKAFVGDPQSKGITAGLEFFPRRSGGDYCTASSYATSTAGLDVPMTALPALAPFDNKLPDLPNGGQTPTRAALKSVAQAAKKFAETHPDERTAIVLMTDGLPYNCSTDDDNIDNVAAEVAGIKNLVPTYVIGVSDDTTSLANLTKIAVAGGTTTATLIDTADPTATQKKFLDTINDIRGKTLSCEVGLPAPPPGEQLDLAKVNVTFTTSAGVKQPLVYDETCATNGWKFDSVTTPSKIMLCNASCDTYKADPTGIVGVEFGCERRVGVR